MKEERAIVHADHHGPLSASSGGGGSGSLPPPPGVRGVWSATFGAMVLCRYQGRIPIVVDDVRVRTGLRPVGLKYAVRTLTTEDRAAGPIIALYGTPLDFDEIYAGGPRPGTLVPAHGLVVSHSCEDESAGYEELLITPTAGEGGATIDAIDIYYRVGTKKFDLKLGYRLIMCGTSPSIAVDCESTRDGNSPPAINESDQ